MVAATSITKRRHAGTHLVPQAGAAGTDALPAVLVREPATAKLKKSRAKAGSTGPRGAKAKRASVPPKATALPPPAIVVPPQAGDTASGAPNVLDDESTR